MPAQKLSFQPCALMAAPILICDLPHLLAEKRKKISEKKIQEKTMEPTLLSHIRKKT
ncbi:MAG: hypothetical protein WBI12_10865 [Methanosarcina flavescens]